MTRLCEICGARPAACADCGRCDDLGCNAGCIFCRHKDEWDQQTRFMADHPLIALTLIGGVLVAAIWQTLGA